MKKSTKLFLLISISGFFICNAVLAKTPRVNKRISNLYQQNFKNENFSYLVDPYAQLCFAQSNFGGLLEIDCKFLKKRPEWRNIIYWGAGESQQE